MKALVVRIVAGLLTYGLGLLLASGTVGKYVAPEEQAWLRTQVGPAAELMAGGVLIFLGALWGWYKHKVNAQQNQDRGAGPLPIIFLAFLMVPGCAAQTQFRIEAVQAVGEAIRQMDVGIDEARTGLEARLAQEEALKQAALADALVYVATDAALAPEARAATVQARLDQFWQQWGVVQTDRANAAERFRRLAAQSAHARLLLSRLLALEREGQGVQRRLEEYRTLAETVARQRLGLTEAIP